MGNGVVPNVSNKCILCRITFLTISDRLVSTFVRALTYGACSEREKGDACIVASGTVASPDVGEEGMLPVGWAVAGGPIMLGGSGDRCQSFIVRAHKPAPFMLLRAAGLTDELEKKAHVCSHASMPVGGDLHAESKELSGRLCICPYNPPKFLEKGGAEQCMPRPTTIASPCQAFVLLSSFTNTLSHGCAITTPFRSPTHALPWW